MSPSADGYAWFRTLRDAFFETYRDTDSGVVKSEPAYSLRMEWLSVMRFRVI
ncbi:hypothetical protein V1527DRAFT_453591 [Lipomyces starkeyi]